MNQRELNQKEDKIITIEPDGIVEITPPDGSAPKKFNFDYSYDDDSLQKTVYQVSCHSNEQSSWLRVPPLQRRSPRPRLSSVGQLLHCLPAAAATP